jgi:acyl-ACP thioesterase
LRLSFSRAAVAGEDLTIRTWYRPERNLYSLRNFSMEDANGKRIIFGESSWVVLDLKKGRPVRLSTAMPASYEENRSEDFPTGFSEIPELDEPDTRSFQCAPHDLDINRTSKTRVTWNGPWRGYLWRCLGHPGRRLLRPFSGCMPVMAILLSPR